MSTKIDNTKTIVDADMGTVKTMLQTHLQTLARSANAAANKHGHDSDIAVSYRGAVDNCQLIIATLKQA